MTVVSFSHLSNLYGLRNAPAEKLRGAKRINGNSKNCSSICRFLNETLGIKLSNLMVVEIFEGNVTIFKFSN